MGSVDSSIPWQEAAALKRAQCLSKIPKEWLLTESFLAKYNLGPTSGTDVVSLDIPRVSGLLSPAELAITENFSAIQLVHELAEGGLTSAAVLSAFSKRAVIAHQLTNCLTETFFVQAEKRAAFLDDYFAKHRRPIGPLHGLPVSIKDNIDYEGVHSTIGYVSFLKHPPALKNSAIVDILLELGAVLYVKTNVPQTMATCDSDNNIFGRTLNPRNLSLTAGGSSGGEAALVAMRGAPVGLGTDLAGSVRMPSLCCGTYGFRPTSGRIPYGGLTTSTAAGFNYVLSCVGPLSNSVEDLELICRATIDAEPYKYDAAINAMPWTRPDQNKTTLRIGVMAEDPKSPLHPPVRRALKSAAKVLEEAGHTLVPIALNTETCVSSAVALLARYFRVDPEVTALRHIFDGNEPMVPSVERGILRSSEGKREPMSVSVLAAMNNERAAMSDAWRKTFMDQEIDVLLCPGAQNTALEHDKYVYYSYTGVWNLMDFPAVIIPYMKASKSLDPEPMTFSAPMMASDYNPEILDGAPCAIQIVARRFEDEKVLHAAKLIDKVLNIKDKSGGAVYPKNGNKCLL